MEMKEIQKDQFEHLWKGETPLFLFVHTPFCGTCQLAENMLRMIENKVSALQIYKLNASLYPDFMEQYQITSVPCLLIVKSGEVQEIFYAFHSVPYLVHKLIPHLGD